ncbi:hypothetical protein [Sphingosinicella sp. LY1275]|uniref:hypothetical protein n=1 Tax=Sphingosinicella sp. LY1275 TaxID=3095379 RepID=UPI002ADEE3E6|nr:hypothetical protein [Sphingosinicella sp. LY1275]MEA1013813.1 hypothetical protein [Sphingosinicella sp. LY1275]
MEREMERLDAGLGDIDQEEERVMGEQDNADRAMMESRASSVGVADFSEALSSGVLRALDAQLARPISGKTFKPWIWAGIWIGPDGPFGGGGGPFGGGGPLGQGGTFGRDAEG